jgi:hypothetical protein
MTDCIDFQGDISPKGYGRVYVRCSGYGAKDHRKRYAHRVAWERERGPIPDEMTIHHVCENRRCVNVDHMELLTRREHQGERHGVLTQALADQIRDLCRAGWQHADVGAAFGVSRSQTGRIARGECWA